MKKRKRKKEEERKQRETKVRKTKTDSKKVFFFTFSSPPWPSRRSPTPPPTAALRALSSAARRTGLSARKEGRRRRFLPLSLHFLLPLLPRRVLSLQASRGNRALSPGPKAGPTPQRPGRFLRSVRAARPREQGAPSESMLERAPRLRALAPPSSERRRRRREGFEKGILGLGEWRGE